MLKVNLELEGHSQDIASQHAVKGAFSSIALRILGAQASSTFVRSAEIPYIPSSVQLTETGISFETNLDLLTVIQGLSVERSGDFINAIFGENASIVPSVNAVSEPHHDISQDNSATVQVQCVGFELNIGVR